MNDRRPSGDRNSYICIIPQRKRSCQLYKTPYFFSFFITKRRTKQYPTRLPSENKSVRKSRSRCRSPSPAGPTSILARTVLALQERGPSESGVRAVAVLRRIGLPLSTVPPFPVGFASSRFAALPVSPCFFRNSRAAEAAA